MEDLVRLRDVRFRDSQSSSGRDQICRSDQGQLEPGREAVVPCIPRGNRRRERREAVLWELVRERLLLRGVPQVGQERRHGVLGSAMCHAG